MYELKQCNFRPFLETVLAFLRFAEATFVLFCQPQKTMKTHTSKKLESLESRLRQFFVNFMPKFRLWTRKPLRLHCTFVANGFCRDLCTFVVEFLSHFSRQFFFGQKAVSSNLFTYWMYVKTVFFAIFVSLNIFLWHSSFLDSIIIPILIRQGPNQFLVFLL